MSSNYFAQQHQPAYLCKGRGVIRTAATKLIHTLFTLTFTFQPLNPNVTAFFISQNIAFSPKTFSNRVDRHY